MLGLPKTRTFKLGIFVAVLEAFSAIALIATSAYLISRASEQPPVLYLMIAVVGVRAFALGRAFFRYVQRLALHDATFTHSSNLRPVVYEKLAELSPGIEREGAGLSLARVTNQVDELQNYPVRVFAPLVQALAALIFTLAVIGVWFPESAAATLVVALIAFLLSQYLSASIASKSEAQRSRLNNQLKSQLVEYLQAADLLGAYGWDGDFRERIAKTAKDIESLDAKSSLSLGLAGSLFSFFSVAAAALAGWFAIERLVEVPGHLLAVAVLTPLALFEVLAMASVASTARSRYSSAKSELQQLLNREPPSRLQVPSGAEEIEEFSSLKFAGVIDFGKDLVSIPEISLRKGEFLAVVGPSGVGKSTLAYCLSSLMVPSEGTFLINGISSENFSLSSKRKTIALCEQHPQLFPGTLRVNLDVSGNQNRQAQSKVFAALGLSEELDARGGLDLELGERGSGLSGGQLQRLSIARALLAGAEVLVLDEPSSGLDWENSQKLVTVLKRLQDEGLTVVLITHDPQLAELASRKVELS